MTLSRFVENTGMRCFQLKLKTLLSVWEALLKSEKRSVDSPDHFGMAPRMTNARNHVIACYYCLQRQVSPWRFCSVPVWFLSFSDKCMCFVQLMSVKFNIPTGEQASAEELNADFLFKSKEKQTKNASNSPASGGQFGHT